MSNKKLTEESTWRTGYYFALVCLVLFGSSLIVIGAALFPQGTLPHLALIGTGISMAPAAIVAALFRVFLFKEVQYQLTQPVLNEVKERLGPEIRNQIESMIEQYRGVGPEIRNHVECIIEHYQSIIEQYQDEIGVLQALRDAGVIRPYRSRDIALKEFASAIDAETSEIMIVGSSLMGLLQKEEYTEIADKLRFKIDRGGVRVKFLLTHPVVADLRAGQEARGSGEIGGEIIKSLRLLKDWNVPTENVRLYKGTPTCFAIKTGHKMLLNPYPYGAVAYDSPCIIVETAADHPSYFYTEFNKSHFRGWNTNVATRIYNYDETICELQEKLPTYADIISQMLKL